MKSKALTDFELLQERLLIEPKTWLITGVAGFIGSNLLEVLLKLNQRVVGMDNLSTGHQNNLDLVKENVNPNSWSKFSFIKGDIRKLSDCKLACEEVDYVLHQAALGSVPRSLEDPISTNESNVTGFLNMLVSAKNAQVKRFVYAASSSTYGDHTQLPKIEDQIGKPLSPYAVTKYVNELYADVFNKNYGLQSIGLRYFNVFGPRQDPQGAYAAVIPKWIKDMIENKPIYINGDGESTRDFCYVENVVQANILAALTQKSDAINQVYNIAVGRNLTLNELFSSIKENLISELPNLNEKQAFYKDFRSGDIRHSLASISKATEMLGYIPTKDATQGLKITVQWYKNRIIKNKSKR